MMPDKCASCAAPLESHAGPGRPATYCSEGCRRLAEFRIRTLVRRIDRYETDRRNLLVRGIDPFDDAARQRRLRALRRWINEDNAALRGLLG